MIDARRQQSNLLHRYVTGIASGAKFHRHLSRIHDILERLGTPEELIQDACVFGLTVRERRRLGTVPHVVQRYDC